jgi:hypothetical protein
MVKTQLQFILTCFLRDSNQPKKKCISRSDFRVFTIACSEAESCPAARINPDPTAAAAGHWHGFGGQSLRVGLQDAGPSVSLMAAAEWLLLLCQWRTRSRC